MHPDNSSVQLIYAIYNLALHGATPAIVAYMLYRLLIGHKGWGAVKNWVGDMPKPDGERLGKRIWVHAVSVGEVMAAHALIKKLREMSKELWMLLTTVTDAGQQVARKQILEVNAIGYLPLDYRWAVTRAMHIVNPHVLVLIEGELWPNIIREAKANLARVVLANGRVSDATYRRALSYARPFYKALLSQFDALLMRTEVDAERIVSMGADEKKVLITGDIKLDVPMKSGNELKRMRERLLKEFGMNESNLIWVAGSTHEGEEELLLHVYKKLLVHFPSLRLIIAPRHIERSKEVAELIAKNRFWCVRRSAIIQGSLKPSAISMASATPVYLLDTVGELKDVYAIATVAFVGGSMIPRGGHNVTEPIIYGCPVVFGKHVYNFRPHAVTLQSFGVGFMVESVEELFNVVLQFLSSSTKREEVRRRSLLLIKENSGAATRTAEQILKLLNL
ncbi:MAG: hypothetical protein RUDDFDWM_000532 [Candidatus Fervidibacterota bacterium]